MKESGFGTRRHWGLPSSSAITSLRWLWVALFLASGVLASRAAEYFVFTSFRGNGEDGLHLAISTNGYHWQALQGDRSFLKPQVGGYNLFFKDERKQPLKKNLRFAVADNPEGPFRRLSDPFTGDWVEGPSVIRIGDEYLVYFDHYAAPHYYGAVRSKDLRQWEECSKRMTFPQGQRHGSVLRIPEKIATRLMESR